MPGLAEPHSQLAVPIVGGGRLLGVLFVESPQDMRFGWDDEDALVAMAGQLGSALRALQLAAPKPDDERRRRPAPRRRSPRAAAPLRCATTTPTTASSSTTTT